MISQQQHNLHRPEEELVPTPAKEKQLSTVGEERQTPTVSEGRSRRTLASPRRWIVVLLCILGIILDIALSLAAGLLAYQPEGWPFGMDIYGIMLAMGVFVALGAFSLGFALRTWWGVLCAALIASAAWFVGQFLSAVAHSPAVDADFWAGQGELLPVALPLIFLVAGLCAWGGMAFRQRWEKQQQTTLSDRS